jgi:hypothetical protein
VQAAITTSNRRSALFVFMSPKRTTSAEFAEAKILAWLSVRLAYSRA